MTSPPWMPLYVGDFIADTMHLYATETGMYIRLLLHCWQHTVIPTDDRQLAMIAHCDGRTWRRYRETVLAFFQPSDGNSMQHSRVTKELRRTFEISKKRKDAAQQKPGRSKATVPAKLIHSQSHKSSLPSSVNSSERGRTSRSGYRRSEQGASAPGDGIFGEGGAGEAGARVMKPTDRVLRSNRQRYQIYRRQGGLCSLCGLPMGPKFEIHHHDRPWCAGGQTVYSIFPRRTLSAIEKREENMGLKYARQLSSNKRVEIFQAVETIGMRYLAGETLTSINMPPRYGKSAIIRLTALEMNALTGMPVVMTAPWTDNVDQIKETEKVTATFKDYGVVLPPHSFIAHRVKAMTTHEWWKQSTGVPTFLTCTIGLINNKANQQQFIDGLNDMRQRSGYRPVVLIDECHLIRELQAWGDFVRRMVEEAGAFVVLLTGTAVPGIPGFECSYGEWKEFIKKIPRGLKEVDGEIKAIREIHEGNRRSLSDIKADIDVTWRHAWDINALAEVNAAWVNIDVVDRATNELLGKLADLKQGELNGRIKEIMEAPEMMRGLARWGSAGCWKNADMRLPPQAIVFTGADELNSDDEQGTIDRSTGTRRHLSGCCSGRPLVVAHRCASSLQRETWRRRTSL